MSGEVLVLLTEESEPRLIAFPSRALAEAQIKELDELAEQGLLMTQASAEIIELEPYAERLVDAVEETARLGDRLQSLGYVRAAGEWFAPGVDVLGGTIGMTLATGIKHAQTAGAWNKEG